MIGYVRPHKPTLASVDFSYYRALYCGLCRSLGETYSPFYRLGVTYDATFWALLFFSLLVKDEQLPLRRCALHPFSTRAIQPAHPILKAASHLTLVLTYQKVADDVRDEGKLSRRILRDQVLESRYKQVLKTYPGLQLALENPLEQLHEAEGRFPPDPLQWAEPNAVLAQAVSRILIEPLLVDLAGHQEVSKASEQPILPLERTDFEHALALIGWLARWVYWIDACEDWQADQKHGRPNPFAEASDAKQAWRWGEWLLTEAEQQMRVIGQCLPYHHHGALIGNILGPGLKAVRACVKRGERLPKT